MIGFVLALFLALVLALVARLCLLSFRQNIRPNPDHQDWLAKSQKERAQREEPELYLFEEKAFIKDFSLKKEPLKRAFFSWEFAFIFLIYGLGFSYLFFTMDQPLAVLIYVVALESLVTLSLVDAQYGIIPDSLQFFMLGVALLSLFVPGGPSLALRLLGFFLAGGFFFILALVGGMGGGDVKLMAISGFWLGLYGIGLALFIGVILGAIWAVILLISKKKSRQDPIAFGPWLALGIYTAALFFHEIIGFLYG